MGIFFETPTKGPDVVGGLWPIKDKARFWNRTGHTISNGMIVQVALTPGEATEAATNDANTYIPGASNDTIWNTVIDPIGSTTIGSSINRGGIWAVCVDQTPIADNSSGMFQVFGICDAYVARSNTNVTEPGSPLTVYASNAAGRINTLDPEILSNEVVVGMLIATSNAALTTKRLKKVFLHNGLFYSLAGIGQA